MKFLKITATLVLLCLTASLAFAENQDKAPPAGGLSKLQIFFTELETQWLKAAQQKDQSALNRIVADDFRELTPAPPGSPVTRADWLLATFSRRLLAFNVRQLAVRELTSTIAVVSFVQTESVQQTATPQTEQHFVVDIWVNSGTGDNWRCTERYLAEIKGVPQK